MVKLNWYKFITNMHDSSTCLDCSKGAVYSTLALARLITPRSTYNKQCVSTRIKLSYSNTHGVFIRIVYQNIRFSDSLEKQRVMCVSNEKG